jgi:nitroreductase
VTQQGYYLYDAANHSLTEISKTDIRAFTGLQEFVKEAPVNLVYVADYSRMGEFTEQQKEVYASADAAFISQNVYLFSASEGLNTGVRGYIDKPALEKAMYLMNTQHVIFAQSVGYPAEQ